MRRDRQRRRGIGLLFLLTVMHVARVDQLHAIIRSHIRVIFMSPMFTKVLCMCLTWPSTSSPDIDSENCPDELRKDGWQWR